MKYYTCRIRLSYIFSEWASEAYSRMEVSVGRLQLYNSANLNSKGALLCLPRTFDSHLGDLGSIPLDSHTKRLSANETKDSSIFVILKSA